MFFFCTFQGPTSFAPIIEMATTIVEQSGGQYHVLVIIADGQVCPRPFPFCTNISLQIIALLWMRKRIKWIFLLHISVCIYPWTGHTKCRYRIWSVKYPGANDSWCYCTSQVMKLWFISLGNYYVPGFHVLVSAWQQKTGTHKVVLHFLWQREDYTTLHL